MSHRYTLYRVVIPLLIIVCSVKTGFCRNGWPLREWKFRRAVLVDVGNDFSGFREGDIARVEFYTGGQTLDNAADIRATTYSGQKVPVKVIMAGPGDRVVIAMGIVGKNKKYFVYWGNKSARRNPLNLEINRGVIQEVWKSYKRPPSSIKDALRIFDSPGTSLGTCFRDRIFQGYNPFGADQRIASRYTGYLKCPEDGKYVFRLASNDASFLLIDDKPVVSNGGRHKPRNKYPARGIVDLKAGTHKITYLHVNYKGYPVAAIAWKLPSARRTRLIPPAAWEKVYITNEAPTETRNSDISLDFSFANKGETFADGLYFQRYVFAAQARTRGAKISEFKWKLGDGTTAAGPEIEHVFTREGIVEVTLEGMVGVRQFSRTHRIFVTRDWARAVWGKLEKTTKHAEIVSQYDFESMDSQSLTGAFVLLKHAGDTKAMVAAARTLLGRDKLSTQAIKKVLYPVIDAMADDGQYVQAANILKSSQAKSKWADVSAGMLVRGGNLLIEADEPEKALKLFDRVVQHYGKLTKSNIIRKGFIGRGDVFRMLGDYEAAVKAYTQAGLLGVDEKNIDFKRGDFARHIEQYLRNNQYKWAGDYLNKWEDAIPLDRLAGYTSLLRVKSFIAQEEYAQAVKLAKIAVTINPAGNLADQLLFEQSRAYKLMGNPEKAAQTIERLKRDYPESSLLSNLSD